MGREAELGPLLREEAAVFGRVQHRNVGRVYATLAEPDLGVVLVRERVAGEELGDFLRGRGPLSVGQTRDLLEALVSALSALEGAGGVAGIDPHDVWIEDATERVVLVRGSLHGATEERRAAQRAFLADVLISCSRGDVASEESTRRRVRAEVVRSLGTPSPEVPPALSPVLEACFVPRGETWTPRVVGRSLAEIPDDPSRRPAEQEECRARAREVVRLMGLADQLHVPLDAAFAPNAVLAQVARAQADDLRPEECASLELELREASDVLGQTLRRACQTHAQTLEAEWGETSEQVLRFGEPHVARSVTDAFERLRVELVASPPEQGARQLERTRALLVETRARAKVGAEQRAREEIDRLARAVDALEARYADVEIAPSWEPKRVRAETQELLEEGRLAEALQAIERAKTAVEAEEERCEEVDLRERARTLAEQAVALRGEASVDGERAAHALAGVDGRLRQMVKLLVRGAFVEARALSDEVAAELRRLGWERELGQVERPTPVRPVEVPAELAEALRILAEAERGIPSASDEQMDRLRTLRHQGEELLGQLDVEQARNAAPDALDRVLESCAAAAEAERRGEYDRAGYELESALSLLRALARRHPEESGPDQPPMPALVTRTQARAAYPGIGRNPRMWVLAAAVLGAFFWWSWVPGPPARPRVSKVVPEPASTGAGAPRMETVAPAPHGSPSPLDPRHLVCRDPRAAGPSRSLGTGETDLLGADPSWLSQRGS